MLLIIVHFKLNDGVHCLLKESDEKKHFKKDGCLSDNQGTFSYIVTHVDHEINIEFAKIEGKYIFGTISLCFPMK